MVHDQMPYKHRVYYGLSFKLGKISEMIIFGSLLTTSEESNIFKAAWAMAKLSIAKNQVKLV